MTFDAMEDCASIETQPTFEKGGNLAKALCEGVDQAPATKPTRQTVGCTAENTKTEADKATLQLEQDGCDSDHQDELRNCNSQVETCEENKAKACACIHSSCSKVMKNRTKEMSNFESTIRNNLFKSSEAVEEKMCDPARAKCKFSSSTETMTRVSIGTEQDLNEDLVDFAGRFKQARDMFKQTIGEDVSHALVETAKEWQDECNERTPDEDKKRER